MTDLCHNLALDVAAGRLSQGEVDEIMATLQMDQGELPFDIIEAGRKVAEDARLAARIERRNRMINITVEQRLTESVRQADALTGSPSDGLRAALVGINAPIEGNLRSVDALSQGLMGQYAGGLVADLRRAGLLTAFNKMKGDFERQVARALSDLNSPTPRGVDVPADAKRVAEIMHKYQKAALDRQNRAGAFIRPRKGYVVRQSHNPGKMQRAGFEAWRAAVVDRLDFDEMGVGIEAREEYMLSAYDAIRSGVRLTQQVNDIERAFKGPRNLAKRDSASRVLVFKDADAWFDYDREFGNGSLRESYMQGLSASARSTAVMTNFGTNPKAMLDKVRANMRKEYRATPEKLRGFDGGVVNLDAALDEVTGDVNIGADSTAARIGTTFRAIQTMAKLGGAWVSALSDIAFVATNRYSQGRSVVESWHDAFLAPMEGLSGGDKRVFADLMGVGLEGQLGDFMARFNAQDEIAGRTSKLMATFFKLNLLGPWSDANKRGVTFMIARDLGSHADQAFDALPDDLRNVLERYGIDARQWNVARLAVKELDGRTYIMPGDVDAVRGGPFTGLSESQQQRLRDQVRDNLFALLTTEADYAVPSPGARERAILRRGYRPGTAAGEAIRYVTQFKSFGVTALTRVIGRQVYGQGAASLREQLGRGLGANMGLVHMIASTTLLGYFVAQAKEVLKGREPRPPNMESFIAGAMQGGGLGIYGDFLFGEASRFGGGTLETLAGPAVGTAAEAVDLFQRARGVVAGGEEDLRGDTLQLVKQNIPFANLFYVKATLDYMLWFHLQESINPGYLRRMERRIERENNQEYWLPPSKVIQPGGGFR